MNKIILLSTLLLSMPAIAYTPKLLLVDQNSGFKQYLDEKSIKKIDKNLMKVVVYDKYTYKNSDEYAKNQILLKRLFPLLCSRKTREKSPHHLLL